MRKVIVVLAVLVIVVLSLGAFAFQNEPDGFRGLKWGDPIQEDMKIFNNNEGVYIRPDDKMSLGNASLYIVTYLFWEGRFWGAGLYFRGEGNYKTIKTICEEKYGDPGLGFYKWEWEGQKSYILLTYEPIEETGTLGIVSSQIALEQADAKREEEAEKAEGDW